MASESKDRRGPRGSRAQIEAVKSNAAEASRQLEMEREESAEQLARTLDEISEGEALAHLDTRISFLERQIERLSARKDEADRGVQGELAIMRARIEDALEAVGAISLEQKDNIVSLEKRTTGLVLESEKRSSGIAESLRENVVGKVHEALSRLERYEARLRGEMKAFEEGSEEHARALVETFTRSRDELDEKIDSVVDDLTSKVDEGTTTLTKRLEEEMGLAKEALEGAKQTVETQMERSVQSVQETLDAKTAEWDGTINDQITELSERTQGSLSHIESLSSELQSRAEALEGMLTERLDSAERAVGERLDWGQHMLEQRLTSAESNLAETISSSEQTAAERIETTQRQVAERIETTERQVAARIETTERQVAERIEASERRLSADDVEYRQQISERMSQLESAVSERLDSSERAIEDRLTNSQASVASQIAEQRADLDAQVEREKREFEARFNEWLAEVKLESARLKESVEKHSSSSTEALEAQKRALLLRIQSAEEKAASSSIRIESLYNQQRKHLMSIEDEWGQALGSFTEDVGNVTIRVEDLAGRVSSAEARAAKERGSSEAATESLSNRVGMLEERLKEAIEEVNNRQANRIEALSSQVAAFSDAEVENEERYGAIEYLKRRVAEMAERLDEIVVKVNAIGRYVTKPKVAAKIGIPLPVLPEGLSERIEEIEKSMAELHQVAEAMRPPPKDLELEERLSHLEDLVAALAPPTAETPGEPASPASTAPSEDDVQVTSTLRRLPLKPNLAQTILPDKKRPRWG